MQINYRYDSETDTFFYEVRNVFDDVLYETPDIEEVIDFLEKSTKEKTIVKGSLSQCLEYMKGLLDER